MPCYENMTIDEKMGTLKLDVLSNDYEAKMCDKI